MPFERIAIVNRGDAASRCVRAIRELRAEERTRLTAIALYTEPDRAAPFVREADEALSLGPALRAPRGAAPRLAYLDHGRVLAALRATRADAVWPGWGFLAEDAGFVEQLEQRGLIFIGPPSRAMRVLGDKIAAKRLAEACDVPVVPWSGGLVEPEQLAGVAARLGYPLLIKASAGGGGRGIRVVERPEDLAVAAARAATEAAHAFGDETLFLESRIARARHIEVQIAADRSGGCLALGLRDCSIQRRHQKVIEEAPPPHLSSALDAALRTAAVRIARAAGCEGLGTVEFLLDADGGFHFLEINPRLQVEHGLTEALTGLDLLQLQLRLARGEPLPARVPIERGHAIEARVCAEDPAADFAPAPGTIVLFDLPSGVRTDTGLGLGSVMPPEFDSLIAKLIAHAPTRAAALAKLSYALGSLRLVLDGGATNKGLLLDLLASAPVQQGGIDVGWLDRTLAALPPAAGAVEAVLAAAILIYQEERGRARLNFLAEAASGQPRSIPPSGGQSVELTYAGHGYRLHVLAIGDWSYRLTCDGRECVARLLELERHAGELVVGDRRHPITVARSEAAWRIEVDGRPHVIGRESGGLVRAAAPAVVVAIEVAVGDRVEAGQRLGLLETMKVEVAFHAPVGGTVAAIRVRRNERVAASAVLLQIHATAAAAPPTTTPRITLPDWEDPLRPAFDASGGADLAALARTEAVARSRAVRALAGAVRRVLLGYDRRPDIDAQLEALLDSPVPSDAGELTAELAELADAIAVFADTEVLFSRQPPVAADGRVGLSNDAWLRLFLRRSGARGAGLPEPFLALLRRALAHYGLATLPPGDALERALLRLYAAQARRTERARLTGALLRLLTRLAAAGVDLSGDEALLAALGTCSLLRGTVPDALADAAAEARSAIFELPAIRRRAAAATAPLDAALAALDRPGAPVADLATLQWLADSPREVFERVGAWARSDHPARRDLALQALLLREYAPRAPRALRSSWARTFTSVRIEYDEPGVVLAALATPASLHDAWRELAEATHREPACAAVELVLATTAPLAPEALRALAAEALAAHPPHAARASFTSLAADGGRAHVSYAPAKDEWGECTELLGMHPESARRLELARLAEFELERLPSPDGLYAFFGRSRRIVSDERIFVLGEVRAALPGGQGTLHEAAFAHVLAEAVRTLRQLRGERDQMRRLHWNRIALVVRPALYLLPETLQRLVDEWTPAIRHLGLEKLVVRLSLRQRLDDSAGREQELVLEPGAGGRMAVSRRAPHREPLRPATPYERALAQARRRGVVHPYEALRLFAAAEGARFEEFDLAADGPPRAVSVAGRAPGGHTAGVVFGVLATPTAKHPEGLTRVWIASDPTRDLGALAAPECDRLVAALDLAEARGLPVEWIATSAGARIAMDSGTENLDATARVVRRIVAFTEAGGEINVVVAGINVGAQSYFDALATMLLHTRGVLIMLPGTSMVLTGRLALEASGSVAAEDEVGIGGFERIMGPNGQAQYYADDLAAAHALLLEHYRYTYRAAGETGPRRHPTTDPPTRSIGEAPYPDDGSGFTRVGELFDDATNPGRKRPFAMRPVMQAVIDRDGGRLERWATMAGAETAIVWDAHLGGHAIALIGIESQNVPRLGHRAVDGPDEWTAGTLFPLSSKKIARAVTAASGNRPVVILANLSGFDGSPESMRTLQLEYGAEIARAVVNFRGPLLFAVLSRYHGGAYVVFSRALNDGLYAVALEGSYASVIGGSAAASAVFGREVEGRTAADPRLGAARAALASAPPERAAALAAELERLRDAIALEQHGEVARAFDRVHTVERARDVGSLDRLVAVAALRRVLIERLDQQP